MSHPTMGAWIEISINVSRKFVLSSHPTMGAWIEIISTIYIYAYIFGRTPRWVRGLKYLEAL